MEGFYVYYKLYSFPGNYQSETVMGSHLRYHILRGLQPGAEYSLRMQCFNVAGTGDYSNTVVRRTSGMCSCRFCLVFCVLISFSISQFVLSL